MKVSVYVLLVIPQFILAKTAITESTKPVILSTGGLCHGPGSSWREDAKYYEKDYSDYYECFVDGGEISVSDSRREIVVQAYKRAAASTERVNSAPSTTDVIEVVAKAKEEQKQESKFLGLDWGLAIALTSLSGGDIIDEVSIETLVENGNDVSRVRVNRSSQYDVELMLEFHKFIFRHEVSIDDEYSRTWGHGPFVSIGLTGTEGKEPLDTFALGWMAGTRISGEEGSFNLGVGWYRDSQVARLRNGVSDGDITNFTNPDDLLKITDDTGWMIIFSASF